MLFKVKRWVHASYSHLAAWDGCRGILKTCPDQLTCFTNAREPCCAGGPSPIPLKDLVGEASLGPGTGGPEQESFPQPVDPSRGLALS